VINSTLFLLGLLLLYVGSFALFSLPWPRVSNRLSFLQFDFRTPGRQLSSWRSSKTFSPVTRCFRTPTSTSWSMASYTRFTASWSHVNWAMWRLTAPTRRQKRPAKLVKKPWKAVWTLCSITVWWKPTRSQTRNRSLCTSRSTWNGWWTSWTRMAAPKWTSSKLISTKWVYPVSCYIVVPLRIRLSFLLFGLISSVYVFCR